MCFRPCEERADRMRELFYLPPSMLWPLVACLVLTGIHVYLGVHVIARKVIFVDLALAQIAALGTVIGVLLGYQAGTDDTALYLYSLAFTVFGAFIFSITKMKGERVPHESIIGIVYAVTFASTILVISRSALGPQELDHILKGELLWVQAPTVLKTAGIYAAVGLFHFFFRREFMLISFEPDRAEANGLNVRLWDFFFYMSFGFVITSSVAIAGVFLVFSYLVIPAVGAMLLSDRLSTRLTIGWIGGAVCSFVGVKLSWDTGLPTSPLVVCVLAVALLAAGLARFFRTAESKSQSIRFVLQSLLVIAVFVFGLLFFRKDTEEPLQHHVAMLESPSGTERVTAISQLAGFVSQKSVWLNKVVDRLNDNDAQVRKAAIEILVSLRDTSILDHVPSLLRDESDAVKSAAILAVRSLGSAVHADELVEAAKGEKDPELFISMTRTAIDLGNPGAIPVLAEFVSQGGFFSDEAYSIVASHLEARFEKRQMASLIRWFRENESRMHWDAEQHKFIVQRK